MKHLVIGQRQKAPNFSAFHWSPHGSLVSIGQHFVATRVVHLPKRTEKSLITESNLITESDQAVRAVHSCNSCFFFNFNGVLPGNETVIFFFSLFFWGGGHFSVRYSVSFTIIIHISMCPID